MKWIQADAMIARGTYWRVYSAINTTNGELVSVKQIELPKDASNADIVKYQAVVKAFRAEIKVLNTLKPLIHPHIVHYLESQELPHLSMLVQATVALHSQPDVLTVSRRRFQTYRSGRWCTSMENSMKMSSNLSPLK